MRSRLSTSLPGLVISRFPKFSPSPFIVPENFRGTRNKTTVDASLIQWSVLVPSPVLVTVYCLPHRPSLNPPLIQLALKNPFHVNRRRMNRIAVQLANIQQVLHLRDRDLRGSRHHRVEVPRRLAINQVPGTVPFPG